MRDIQSHFVQGKRIDRLLADLTVIADWRDDLLSRIRYAVWRYESIGLDVDEQKALAADVTAFKQVSLGLADALVDADHEGKQAA